MDTAMSQVVVYDSELYEGYVPPPPLFFFNYELCISSYW